VRSEYLTLIEKASMEILDKVKQKLITAKRGAEAAVDMRNQILEAQRGKSSEIALAIAKWLKENGKTMAELQEKYAHSMFKKSFDALTTAERQSTCMKIIQKAGEDNGMVTKVARVLGPAGRCLMVLNIAIFFHNIANAEDKQRAFEREVVEGAGAVIGGIAGTSAATAIVGAAALTATGFGPLIVGTGFLVGTVIGVMGGDYLLQGVGDGIWAEFDPDGSYQWSNEYLR
jgi:hypothetical protein